MEKASYASRSSGNLVDRRPVKVIPVQLPEEEPFSPVTAWSRGVTRWRTKMKGMTAAKCIATFLPCYRWIRSYQWQDCLQNDLMAGITVGVMLVPQAMSYAKLAGLAPIYGLYSGCIPVFVYALFGSSRQLAVGPVALTSLMITSVLSGILDSSDELYTELAITLALMVGVLECIMGLLRLGWIIRFISHSVISGFTTASAIIIALSQAKYFLGYHIVRSSEIIPLVKSILHGLHQFSWPPFMMGSLILAVMLIMKHLGKTRKSLKFIRAAGPLTGVVLGTVIVNIFHPSSISVVGEIPQGLPKFSVPKAFDYVQSLIPTTFIVTGVAILESVGIAKALATKNGYDLDPNQELFGLGVANICGSFFSAYPTTGSFSRSAVNHESGAKTGFAGIITGIIISCALMFLTPLFETIPQCSLAAIVISAVMGLVDYKEAILLWRIDKKDFFHWSITFASTLFLGIEIGVFVGVGFSLAFVIHESANPQITILGRLPGTTIYRNIQQYPEAYIHQGMVIVHVNAPIYFANISYIKDRLREYESNLDEYTRHGPQVEQLYFVILEMSSVTYVDSSAAQALKDLYNEYRSRGIQIVIANPNHEVLLTLKNAGLVELIGEEWYFVRAHDAVQICLENIQSLDASPRASGSFTKRNPILFKKPSQIKEDSFNFDLELGDQNPLAGSSSNHQLIEPLLPRTTT